MGTRGITTLSQRQQAEIFAKLTSANQEVKDIRATKTIKVKESFITFKIPEPTNWLTCAVS